MTIGKRISNRIFLTYARSLSSTTRDQIILLEFDESESLSWVLSQNEDRTYALEVQKEARLLMLRHRARPLLFMCAVDADGGAAGIFSARPSPMSASRSPASPVAESGVLELVETRIGEPLAMQDVRGTIEHLVGLGRFEDVRVFASGHRPGRGAALAADAGAGESPGSRWPATPCCRRRTSAARSPIDSARRRRRTAIADMVARLKAYYAARGLPSRPSILPRVRGGRSGSRGVELVLTIDAGRAS